MYSLSCDMNDDQIWQYVKEDENPPEGFYIDYDEVSDDIILMNEILKDNSYGDTSEEMVWEHARNSYYTPNFEGIYGILVTLDFKSLCEDLDAELICNTSEYVNDTNFHVKTKNGDLMSVQEFADKFQLCKKVS